MENSIISNRYRILEKIGDGGFGQTFRAEDLHLPTRPHCVVKQLKSAQISPESLALARRLFEQEAAVLYKLGTHAKIPKLHAHFEEAGEFYLVQELIVGRTLAEELVDGRFFSESKALKMLAQILEILSFVHERGVIHRDIKPQNLIRRMSDGAIVLIDFGAVKQIRQPAAEFDSAAQSSSIVIGSEGFMPPEQLAGKPRFQSDIYAAGIVTIQTLTGLHPAQMRFNENTGEIVWHNGKTVNADFAQFLSKMIRYDYRTRFATADEALAALRFVSKNAAVPIGAQNSTQTFARRKSPQQIAPTILQLPNNIAPPTNFNRSFNQFAPAENKNSTANIIMGISFSALTILVALVFAVWGIASVVSFGGGSSREVEIRLPRTNSASPPDYSPPAAVQTAPSTDLFAQAERAAAEARAKEFNASTKSEWKTASRQWQRAASLLRGVPPTDWNYKEAQKNIEDYEAKAGIADSKSFSAPRN